MQRIILAAVTMLAASGCLPVEERDVIVVNGEGVVTVTPEIFTVSATLHSRNASRAEALAAVAATLARITQDLPKLEGLEKLEISPSSAEIGPVYNVECARQSAYQDDPACPIEGYVAKVALTARGAPANVAGNALSLLSEFGAQQAELSGYSVIDYDKAKAEAAAAAMKNARAKAERLAGAAGAVLGGPTRIQYGEDFDGSPYDSAAAAFDSDEMIVVTGSRIPAAVNLNLTPQPFEVRETVKAAFAIE